MTEKQFNSLKIGDKVMDASLNKEKVVTDINREDGTINTGGSWRRFKHVRLAGIPEPEYYTHLEPITHITMPIKMLMRSPLIEIAIVQTIHRAGSDGFIGTTETLFEAVQVCASFGTFSPTVGRMVREGVIIRKNLVGRVKKFTVNKNVLKDYL